MATMKIQNYEDANSGYAADAFSFPENSRTFNDKLSKFQDIMTFKYAFTYIGLTDPLKSTRNITIAGSFFGSTKEASYRALAKHSNESKLKEFYFSADKFMIVIPNGPARTQSGGRTNFIDYTASFFSPFGILFKGGTAKSGNAGAADKNEGNVPTPIIKITGTVTSGSLVTIKDKYDNGIKFTPTASGTATIYLINLSDLGGENKMTEYLYTLISTTAQKLTNADNSGSMFMKLNADESLGTLFTGGTVSGITSLVCYFRDGFSSD